MFDLHGYIAARAARAGVGDFEDLGLDTYADEARFFSYRRATHRREPDYGRLVSAIALDAARTPRLLGFDCVSNSLVAGKKQGISPIEFRTQTSRESIREGRELIRHLDRISKNGSKIELPSHRGPQAAPSAIIPRTSAPGCTVNPRIDSERHAVTKA